jgi:poly(3-hydroxybutyrate) depolymerase
MTPKTFVRTAGLLAGLAFSVTLAFPPAHLAAPQQAPAVAPAQQGAPGGGRGAAIDPRVQQRTYKFTFGETNEDVPYALFVSSKVNSAKKNPLIISLHGLGGNQNTMMRSNGLDLAEEGGYIYVGSMGYTGSGWYGAPSTMAARGNVTIGGPRGGAPGGGRGAGPGAGGPGAGAPGAGGPGAGGPGAGAPGAGGPGAAARGAGPGGGARGGSTVLGTPNEVSQMSEKDVMNVLDMMRKEFNVDENRIYIMGHSMGGAGAMYLGVKHASIWAGIGAMAPATAPAGINPNNYPLDPAKAIPFIIVQGDLDTTVPPAGARQWIAKMKELNITNEYVEVVGGTHGSVLTTGMADIFGFFAKHSKTATR